MTYLFKNNAASTLAATCAISDLSLTVAAGQGSRFPAPGAGESFLVTIQQASSIEVVECTSRAADVLTIQRAKEGTSAQTWTAGASVTLRVTETSLNTFVQQADADAAYAPINGPISLSADPVSSTQAARKGYVDNRETAIRTDLGQDILNRGALIGEVKEYHGLDLPARYLWADGGEYSRTTYSALFDALTRALVATVTSGSPTITITSGSLDRLAIGMPISFPTYFAPGTTITSIGAGTLTLSSNALSSGTGLSFRVCPHGAGNNTTTFNTPDRRGRVGVGRDGMGGATASRVTTANSGIQGTRLGAGGGDERTPAHNHGVTDPGHSHGVTDPGHNHQISGIQTDGTFSGGGAAPYPGGVSVTGNRVTGITVNSNTTGITVNTAGAGTSQNVQPSYICNYIIFANV